MVVDFGPFQKTILSAMGAELVLVHKVVMHPVALAGAGRAGGPRNRQRNVWVFVNKAARQSGFARS
jgi:hypothetical protein